MKRRIFIAVNLPEQAKKILRQFREKFDYLPVRWTKEASLHLTLVFIGYVSDEQMLETCRITREIAAEFEPFFIDFRRVILGPSDKPPRMIWLEGEANRELSELKNKLEVALLDADSGFSRQKNRSLKPHITLARIKTGKWRQLPQPPEINELFNLKIPVESIEIMESDLRRGGAEYAVLETCPLNES